MTEDNTCVLFLTFKSEKIEYIQIFEKIHSKDQKSAIFIRVEELLEKKPINLFQFESVIISGKMEEIWNLITNLNNLSVIAPNNNCFPNINIRQMSKGETKIIPFLCDNKLMEIGITLQHFDERKGWNKWVFVITISKGDPKKQPEQTIFVQLTKINKSECQLSFISKFHISIETKKFKTICERKKYILLSLKDYFDNFYSPGVNN